MSEYYSSQKEYEAEMDALNDGFVDHQPASFADLKTSDNDAVFELLVKIMDSSQPLNLVCGIDSGMAFYEFEVDGGVKRKLFLNRDIWSYVNHYLMYGKKKPDYPNIFNVDKKVDENYIFYMYKYDRANNASRYNPTSKEYKAVHSHGIVNYGVFPYTPEEMIKKLIWAR